MATISFETLQFSDRNDHIKVDFLRMFSFDISKDELGQFGPVSVSRDALEFPKMQQGSAERKFNRILSHGFLHLKNKLNGKPTVYVHRGSGIPLRGHIAFGLIDRGSNIIEIKPVTSCNIECTYCSVNEDVRPVDFVVELDYLVEEFKKMVKEKECDHIEAHIASQGEPTLYADFTLLVKKLAEIPEVKQITTDTNGTLLTPAKIDEIIDAGFTRFNLSINAMDPELAKRIAHAPYNIEHVKKVAKHIADSSCDLQISPTLIPGVNEEEMPKIIEFAKSIESDNWKAKIGIQNFLYYQFGRNPAEQMEWEKFFSQLREWEKQYDVKLVLDQSDFGITPAKSLPKVFKKNEIVKAEIKCRGRLAGEKIAAARGYCISVPKCRTEKGNVKLKITKTKHHLYHGVVV